VKLDKFGPWAIYRTLIGGTWLITTAALLKAGVRLEDAVRQTAEGADPWLSDRLKAITSGLSRGMNLGESMLRSGYDFPDVDIIDDLMIYSKYSGVDSAMESLAKQWVNDSVEIVKLKMGAIFSIGIVVVALTIGFLVGGFIDMQMQMTDIVKRGF